MFSKVATAALQGLSVEFVQVEADISTGLPCFHLVGYLSSEVKEAGERVKTAIRNSGFYFPAKRIVVNLSPADIRKRGSIFDVAIAVAVLGALGEVPLKKQSQTLFLGELSLDGRLKKVSGILPIVYAAEKAGYRMCVVPYDNLKEALLVKNIKIIGMNHMKELCDFLKTGKFIVHPQEEKTDKEPQKEVLDFSDLKGQYLVKRAVEIAVAGNHNLLMVGPPGAGKSAIAKRIPGILPSMTERESMELTMLYSAIGKLDTEHPQVRIRPFREIHHSITKTALIGGGKIPQPGEITLANKGVLFLDEFAEFSKQTLEMLRVPLEEKTIRIIRERGIYDFPCDFMLVAAMNPCPCGNYPDLNRCTCTTTQILTYMNKLSQPLLDRIDICVEVPKVDYEELMNQQKEEDSVSIKKRIMRTRRIQEERYSHLDIFTNSQLRMNEIEEFCYLGMEEKKMMAMAYEKYKLTARTYHKVLCVARTIADLEEEEYIRLQHIREALSYRNIGYQNWRR